MNFTPFLQAFLLIITLLLFVIWDIVFYKITLRVISTIILLCFNIWSYTYYFKIEELKEELFNLRFANATGNLEKPSRIKEIRKTIARIKMVIREREINNK